MRMALLAVVSIAAVLAVALHAPIPQPSAYHTFADQRQIFGVPNLIAKLLENADEAVFAQGHLLSGHTLKHLAAGVAMYLFLLAIRHRRPFASRDLPPAQQIARA